MAVHVLNKEIVVKKSFNVGDTIMVSASDLLGMSRQAKYTGKLGTVRLVEGAMYYIEFDDGPKGRDVAFQAKDLFHIPR